MDMRTVQVPGEVLEQMLAASKASAPTRPKPIQARVLKDMIEAVRRPNPFGIGDLVEQVEAFQAYNMPVVGKTIGVVTGLVAELSPEARRAIADDNICNPRVDILVLVGTSNDRWLEVACESWRFKRYEGEVE